MPSVVDIFCGVGGLTHGFLQQGFNVVAGIDNDETCRYPYEVNNPNAQFIASKLEDMTSDEINNLFGDETVRILVGCAPCQPFSTYSQRYDEDTFQDKWHLVQAFAELIMEIQPEIISMENVPALQRSNVYQEFKQILGTEYHLDEKVLYAPDYGIPQTRKRLVVIGSRFGKIKILPPTHKPEQYATVQETIGHLPEIQAGDVDENDPLHRTRNLSEINLKRIRQSLPGGTWRDWDEEILATCHRKATGRSYSSVYGRMEWDKPSPTITTQAYSYGSGRFGHPGQDRALSLREMAILQTFPQNYKFTDPQSNDYSFTRIGRQIGNAVPVELSRIIAESIERHLEQNGIGTNR